MKNYKQILEAVDRGIQIALDNYEDIEQNSSKSSTSDVLDNDIILTHYINFYGIIEKLGVSFVSAWDIDKIIVYSKENNIKYKPIDKNDLIRILKEFLFQHNHADLNWIDTSRITDMSGIFANCVFNGDISEWDTSNVRNMSRMFENNQMFNCDISNWDVGNLINAERMFYKASNFNCDISKWDPHNLENGSEMFYGTTSLSSNIDLSKWKLYKCTKFGHMFTESGLTRRTFKCPEFFPPKIQTKD